MADAFSLQGKAALVSGGSRGIGKDIALMLSQRSATAGLPAAASYFLTASTASASLIRAASHWSTSWLSPRTIRSRPRHKDLRQVVTAGFFCYQGRMNTIFDFFRNLWSALGCVGELLGYLLRLVSVFSQSRVSLAARLLAAESQLGMCKRRIEQKAQPKPRFTAGFRLLWVVLSKLWAPWQAAAQLMQPATVKA